MKELHRMQAMKQPSAERGRPRPCVARVHPREDRCPTQHTSDQRRFFTTLVLLSCPPTIFHRRRHESWDRRGQVRTDGCNEKIGTDTPAKHPDARLLAMLLLSCCSHTPSCLRRCSPVAHILHLHPTSVGSVGLLGRVIWYFSFSQSKFSQPSPVVLSVGVVLFVWPLPSFLLLLPSYVCFLFPVQLFLSFGATRLVAAYVPDALLSLSRRFSLLDR